MHTKIIFFDIDGTIMSHRTYLISEGTLKAIRKARANGHLVFVNTGRTLGEIDDVTKAVGFDGFVCGCGTNIIYQGKNLLRSSLPENLCRKIITDLRKYRIEAILEGTEAVYFDKHTNYHPLIRQRDNFINKYHFNVLDWDAEDISFDKLCIWYDKAEKGANFFKEYSDIFDFIDREGNLYEVVQKGYSKATGIEFLLSHLNIPHENSYALGDGSNDLPMLKYVKHAIGMGNSNGGVPEVVSFLTKDVDEDGVAHALKHYKII